MLPQERCDVIKEFISQLVTRKQTPAREFLRLLGIMAACIEVVFWARLHMRPIQMYLMCFWTPSSREIEAQVPIRGHIIPHLKWWREDKNLLKGLPLEEP